MNLFTLIVLILCLDKMSRWWLIVRFFAKKKPETQIFEQIVSALQPILSGDPTLWQCLEENLQMQTGYELEFLWLIDTTDPEARRGCLELMSRYPQKQVRLLTFPPPPPDVNPKTFKLLAALPETKGKIIVVLDDDTVLPDFGLEQCLPRLADKGLVFGLPYYVHFRGFWSAMVAGFVNSQSLFTYIPYTFFSKPLTINGMFYALQKETFEIFARNPHLPHALTDDYAIATLCREHGFQMCQTAVCHPVRTHVADFRRYIRLLKRWFVFPQTSLMQTRQPRELIIFGWGTLPVFFPLLLLIGAVFSGNVQSGLWAMGYSLFSLLLVFQLNQNYLRKATPWFYYPAMWLQMLILPFYIVYALFSSRQIVWRGKKMTLGQNGTFRVEDIQSS
jgi:ceramide glucosyltransferase